MTIKTTISTTDKSQKIPKEFCCTNCNYITSNKKDFNKHLLTIKHINNASTIETPKNPQKNDPERGEYYICDVCDKKHKDRAGLWRHKKKCSQMNNNTNNTKENVETPNPLFTNDFVITLINQNKELQNLLMEDRKIFMEERKSSQNSVSNSNNNNNNNNINTINSNNSFNLNFFLNEQCKNAVNLVDFIDSLKVGVKDLERTGRLGYVEGISKIFLDGLKELDVYNRPIHCTDLKRETVYVRDQDKWEKENEEKTKLTEAVKKITVKNLKQLPNWEEENPEFSDFDSKKNDEYMAISKSSLGGYDSEEERKFKENIIKNVLKQARVPARTIE